MPGAEEWLPTPPWTGPPLPRFLNRSWQDKPTAVNQQPPTIEYGACEYGIECIKNHMLRAHLFISEALRFSANGQITTEAQAKLTSAREQLLCEDDFQKAMDAPPAIKMEVLKLLASTRSTWKAIEKSGIDVGMGEVSDIKEAADAVQSLFRKAYDIDRQYRLSKGALKP